MKQVYIASYFRSGYSRFMQFINNILDHPKRETIEKRLEIIKFCDEFGFEATRRALGKVGGSRARQVLEASLARETDESARKEIQAALAAA